MAVGIDNVTPWFILLFLGAKVFDVIRSMMALADVPEEVKRQLKIGPGAFITTACVDVLVFFAVAATLIWLAVFIASKIMKFPLPDSAYLKAAGVAAIPSVVVTLIQILPLNLVLDAGLILTILPVTLWVLKFAFDMTWPEALVAYAFVVPLYVVGWIIRILVIGAVMLGFGFSGLDLSHGKIQAPSGMFGGSDNSGPSSSSSHYQSSPSWQSGQQNPSPAPSNWDPLADRVTAFQRNVENLSGRPTERSSREDMLAQEKQLRAEIESQRATLAAKPGYDALFPALDAVRQKFMALPSEKPDDAVFRDPTPTATWNDAATAPPSLLGPEISFKEFKLRPPADARLDLKTSENDPNGLSWHDAKEWGANMTIALVPRQNAAQKQPWVMTQSFMSKVREQQRLFAIEATESSIAPVTVGSINGLAFIRVESDPQSQHSFDRWVKYAALDGDRWLVMTIRTPKENARVKEGFELAAHSIRKAANEPHADAFSPAALVARLEDDTTQASALLRRQGAAAEDALDAGLASNDQRTRQHSAALLRELATAKSLPALREAVKSSDREVSESARSALRRVAPKEFDAVAEALLDLKGDGHREKEQALLSLATATPDGRRAEVATVLEDMLVNKKATFQEKNVAKALSVWYGPNTVTRLLPLLTKQHWGAEREAAMEVLGATKDKRAVMPIVVPWLLEDPDHAVPALVQIGQPAEDELVAKRVMWEPNGKVRTACAQVLEQIGTAKSLEGLRRGAHDSRDAAAAVAAQTALDAVTARVSAAKPGK